MRSKYNKINHNNEGRNTDNKNGKNIYKYSNEQLTEEVENQILNKSQPKS